jgi:hypothetical protein
MDIVEMLRACGDGISSEAADTIDRLRALLLEGVALQCVRDSPSLGAQRWKDKVRKERGG